jgi:DNA repair protein RadC
VSNLFDANLLNILVQTFKTKSEANGLSKRPLQHSGVLSSAAFSSQRIKKNLPG